MNCANIQGHEGEQKISLDIAISPSIADDSKVYFSFLLAQFREMGNKIRNLKKWDECVNILTLAVGRCFIYQLRKMIGCAQHLVAVCNSSFDQTVQNVPNKRTKQNLRVGEIRFDRPRLLVSVKAELFPVVCGFNKKWIGKKIYWKDADGRSSTCRRLHNRSPDDWTSFLIPNQLLPDMLECNRSASPLTLNFDWINQFISGWIPITPRVLYDL